MEAQVVDLVDVVAEDSSPPFSFGSWPHESSFALDCINRSVGVVTAIGRGAYTNEQDQNEDRAEAELESPRPA